ncbi:hypothetical protein [Streptosporangium sp. NPDC003464]
MLLVPLLSALVAVWWLINVLVRHRTRQAARPFWLVSSAVVLLPTITSMVLVSIL